jgi:murein DD-endopeptidase MepM/ murein hydrolase activator NlpD
VERQGGVGAENGQSDRQADVTVQVVPGAGGTVRTWVISPSRLRTLKRALWGAAFAVTLLFVLALVGVAQSLRVRVLSDELLRVTAERDQLLRVEEALSEIETAYAQLQRILGIGAPTGATWLPRPGGTATPASSGARSEVPGIPSLWPLTERGFLTRLLLIDDGREDEDHPGIDIAIPSGSYIRASGPGLVAETGEDPVYGLFVRIEHANGLETLYGHASAVVVEAGRPVRAGEVIAFVGSSGRSSAPHLHFEIRRDGVPVDPLTFVTRP